MKQVILGTAGHIDHGKTALVKALTGTDTDRLKEEKERGITIDLGFANLKLEDDIDVGIVDVPGHERFVKNMLAGVGGIDLVALIVAADEGVMPQTREHLAICQLMSIKSGLVVLTKTDMVDDEDWMGLVEDDVKEFLKGTFLAGQPIVSTSSKTGEGMEELLAQLTLLAGKVEPKKIINPFRMPVDRVFTMKGFGTVITGTVTSGAIGVEDQVEVFPQRFTSRIRSIQVHNSSVDKALAGQRTALNLSGIEKSSVVRGNVVSLPDRLLPAVILDAVMALLDSAPHPLKNRGRVRFHHGTTEVMARVAILERKQLEPGEEEYVQLILERPVCALPGDRFVVRSYSPMVTIGGGRILEVNTTRYRRHRKEGIRDHFQALENGEDEERLEALLLRAGESGLGLEELFPRFDLTLDRLKKLVKRLSNKGVTVSIDDEKMVVMHHDPFQAMGLRILDLLYAFHKENSLKRGRGREELRGKAASASEKAFNRCLDLLAKEGKVVIDKNLVRLPSHKVELQEDQTRTKKRLEQELLDSGFQPPSPQEAFDHLSISSQTGGEMMQLLISEGVLIRIKEKIIYHKTNLVKAEDTLQQYLKANKEITAAQFRDILGISRKYAIPLLEHFDNKRITFRKGDVRVLRNAN